MNAVSEDCDLHLSEEAVLQYLLGNADGLPPEKVIEDVLLKSTTLTAMDVKRAIWNLMARGDVSLSSAQELEATARVRRKVA